MAENKRQYVNLQRSDSGQISDITKAPLQWGVDTWEKQGRPDELSLSYDQSTQILSVAFKVKDYDYSNGRTDELNEQIGQSTPEDLEKTAIELYKRMGAGYSRAEYAMEDGMEYGTTVEFSTKLSDPEQAPVVLDEIKKILADEKWTAPQIEAFFANVPDVEEQIALKFDKRKETEAHTDKQNQIKNEGTVAFNSKHTDEQGVDHYHGIHNQLDGDKRPHDFVTSVAVDKEMSLLTLTVPSYGDEAEASQKFVADVKAKGIAARMQRGSGGNNDIVINYQGVMPAKLKDVFSKEGAGANILPAEAMQSMGMESAHANTVAARPSAWAATVRS